MLRDDRLATIATALASLPDIVGVVLGGSRTRGEHAPDSDVDLGLYYRSRLNTEALGLLARELAGPEARVTAVGEWGPWVNGGAWLDIDGSRMELDFRPYAAAGSSASRVISIS